ncbi:hypothetical protein APY04_0801 [Hyphomicrobium sulfonivorans]|uniref:Uncharacterized protein n=1 Tax=Hyphomicrobium sulfonivorans TaxID=121290 RepID=A0A125NVS7_HYPSL|nr:hypothetical protein [Hyphomicrobium sulfonivorans]KWT70740.1 hypothetical protein APY04_0801 [Hyphomicrobium sulfonivorans]
MSAEDIAKREIAEIYNTHELRTAYRAGLSTAMGICDERAAAYKRTKRNNESIYGASAATGCGNDIEALWRSILADEVKA